MIINKAITNNILIIEKEIKLAYFAHQSAHLLQICVDLPYWSTLVSLISVGFIILPQWLQIIGFIIIEKW